MPKNKKGRKNNKMAGRIRPTSEQSHVTECKQVPVVLSDTSEVEDPMHPKIDPGSTSPEPGASTSDSGFDSGRGSPGDEAGSTAAIGDSEADGEKKAHKEKVTETTTAESELETNPAADVSSRADSRTAPADFKPDKMLRIKSVSNFGMKTGDNIDSRTKEKAVKIKTEDKTGEIKTEDKAGETKTGDKVEMKTEDKVEIKTEDKVESNTKEKPEIKKESEIYKDLPGKEWRGKGGRGDKEKEKPDEEPGTDGDSPPVVVRRKGASSLKRNRIPETIKHPLEFPWEFWVMRQDVPWDEALSRCAAFDTAEDFWYYFNAISNPRAAATPILMFKRDIRPEWEDPQNSDGYRWNLINGLQGRLAADVWQELALMLIGGIEFGSKTQHLNGIYCTWKNDGLHFSVWLSNVATSTAIEIGEIIHGILNTVLKRPFPMELGLIKSDSSYKGRKRPISFIR